MGGGNDVAHGDVDGANRNYDGNGECNTINFNVYFGNCFDTVMAKIWAGKIVQAGSDETCGCNGASDGGGGTN